MTRLVTTNSSSQTPWLSRIVTLGTGSEIAGLLMLLAVVVLVFSLATDRFLTVPTFTSVAFQLPELGLLTLAMLIPILSGGLNLAITFTANICGLVLAWVLQANGGVEAGMLAFLLGGLAAVAVGALIGWVMGAAIAYTGAHPILVSLSMMIFLRGLGEFATRGGDISGFPHFVGMLGHGWFAGIPAPLWILIACVALWHLILNKTRLGLTIYMAGSNIEATRYSGIDTKRTIMLVYTLSGLMCGIAGILMLARFNSVRVGHGEAYLLITVLACFLGRVDPFGGFGRALPVALALLILQVISSGLNLLGANQHLATAMWGAFLIVVMVVRHVLAGRSVRRT
jgi:simple sugar transport system permease protein